MLYIFVVDTGVLCMFYRQTLLLRTASL